ncbi:MAG: SCP2 sterol-binding domain-containing protein [Acidimicrobiales bacterium]|jgi:putative sterol carrier protein
MTSWFSDEWFAAVRPELAGIEGPSSLSGTVQVDVTGGDGGDASCHLEFAGGRLVDAGPGGSNGADATLTVSEGDARDILVGRLDPSVAFMQGRMKVAGSMAPVIDLLSLSATDEARARRARVAGVSGLV